MEWNGSKGKIVFQKTEIVSGQVFLPRKEIRNEHKVGYQIIYMDTTLNAILFIDIPTIESLTLFWQHCVESLSSCFYLIEIQV